MKLTCGTTAAAGKAKAAKAAKVLACTQLCPIILQKCT
jgi:hypothetical protein